MALTVEAKPCCSTMLALDMFSGSSLCLASGQVDHLKTLKSVWERLVTAKYHGPFFKFRKDIRHFGIAASVQHSFFGRAEAADAWVPLP